MARFVRSVLRLIPILGLLLLIGVSFASPGPKSAEGKDTPVIDTSGPVQMSQCAQCHKDLEAWDNPNLVNFTHKAHLKQGIQCQACHVVFPHQPSGMVKPTMALCANCHRQQHGSQGKTAPGDCDFCHPAEFELTPKDHKKADFAGAGHTDDADAQECLVCHLGSECESCHEENGVGKASGRSYRWFGLWPVVKGEGRKIRVGQEITMASCQACHRDLELWENSKLINFRHSPHFQRQIKCDKCHDKWPHEPGKTNRPEMSACARCHRLTHGAQGKLVSVEGQDLQAYCAFCHPKDMNLIPDWHTADFVDGGHKTDAKADRGICRQCHVQSFCDNCHLTEIPHVSGWRSEHGREVVSMVDQGDKVSCFRCHLRGERPVSRSAPSCAKCHKAVVYPHPKPWAPQHGQTANSVGRDVCSTCHLSEVFCDSCHGGVQMPHQENWLGEHNLFLRDNSAVSCLNCHKKTQCEQCHSIHKIHNRHTNFSEDL